MAFWIKIGPWDKTPLKKYLIAFDEVLKRFSAHTHINVVEEDNIEARWELWLNSKYKGDKKLHSLNTKGLNKVKQKSLQDRLREMSFRIDAYLVDIPDDEQYQRLAFRKTLVIQNFNIASLEHSPQKISAVVFASFDEYQNNYKKIYVEEFSRYVVIAKQFYRDQKIYVERQAALRRLSQIVKIAGSELGDLENIQNYLESKFHVVDIARKDMYNLLFSEPYINDYHLGDLVKLEYELQRLDRSSEQLLAKQIKKIQSLAVKNLVKRRGGEALDKLLDLIGLAQVDKIVALVAGEEGQYVIDELKKVVGNV